MISATLKFLAPSDAPPVYYASVGGSAATLELEGQFENVVVQIEDGRPNQTKHTLDVEGFKLVDHASAVTDFYDLNQIENVYETEIRALVTNATGANRVFIFDHTHRADSKLQRSEYGTREPSSVVHNDYTDKSARQRVVDMLPAENIDILLNHRFAIINIWRAIGHPAETSQLALCNAETLKTSDVIAVERRAEDRIGELMMATYNSSARWTCFPSMRPNEALLLKTYDSATDGRARFSLHTAFDNPDAPENAKPRESLETRVFAFF